MKQLEVLIRKFYALSVIAHVAHVNTKSFAAHEALGDFYDGVNTFKDRLIEYLIGEGKLIKVEAAMLECGGEVVAEAEATATMFCNLAKQIGDEALVNMSGEFEESVGKLKFLMMLK